VLALLVIATAATTLTIALGLQGATDRPYEHTRTATAGPDAVAGFVREDGSPPTRQPSMRSPGCPA
jgi:putative ABC transport system permease protein